MLITTFNCNSVRVRLPIILAWLEQYTPDVLALQETKCTDEEFPADAFTEAGWYVVYRGEKGYNGVAMVTYELPDEVSFGLEDDDGESETRLAYVRLGDVHVLNTYVPQGYALETERFQFKLDWFARLRKYIDDRFDARESRLVWVGDLNVAREAIDVYDPEGIWPHVCYCPEAVDALESIVSWGLVDVFRKHLPGEGIYTFWDYRLRGSVKRNLGWRLDHVFATESAAAASTECFVDVEPRKAERPSDHTFVGARFQV